MITIKTIPQDKYGKAEIKIAKNTPYTTMLLGAEMLIEQIVQSKGYDIDFVLDDIKRIYIRDNGEKDESNNN